MVRLDIPLSQGREDRRVCMTVFRGVNDADVLGIRRPWFNAQEDMNVGQDS